MWINRLIVVPDWVARDAAIRAAVEATLIPASVYESWSSWFKDVVGADPGLVARRVSAEPVVVVTVKGRSIHVTVSLYSEGEEAARLVHYRLDNTTPVKAALAVLSGIIGERLDRTTVAYIDGVRLDDLLAVVRKPWLATLYYHDAASVSVTGWVNPVFARIAAAIVAAVTASLYRTEPHAVVVSELTPPPKDLYMCVFCDSLGAICLYEFIHASSFNVYEHLVLRVKGRRSRVYGDAELVRRLHSYLSSGRTTSCMLSP